MIPAEHFAVMRDSNASPLNEAQRETLRRYRGDMEEYLNSGKTITYGKSCTFTEGYEHKFVLPLKRDAA